MRPTDHELGCVVRSAEPAERAARSRSGWLVRGKPFSVPESERNALDALPSFLRTLLLFSSLVYNLPLGRTRGSLVTESLLWRGVGIESVRHLSHPPEPTLPRPRTVCSQLGSSFKVLTPIA